MFIAEMTSPNGYVQIIELNSLEREAAIKEMEIIIQAHDSWDVLSVKVHQVTETIKLDVQAIMLKVFSDELARFKVAEVEMFGARKG